MSNRQSPLYTLAFAAIICTLCSVLVSVAVVSLRPLQEINIQTDRQKNVLVAAALLGAEEETSAEKIQSLYDTSVKPVVIRQATGEIASEIDPLAFDQRTAAQDPEISSWAPANKAGISRIPEHLTVYRVEAGNNPSLVVLPVTGKGLWSTMYGFLAMDANNPAVVRGIAFYEHGETPGLGGEIENPQWQALWTGRRALDENFSPVFSLVKGTAGSIEEDPHHVDALTGATMTSNGVTAMIQFWLGDYGYGPFLKRLNRERGE